MNNRRGTTTTATTTTASNPNRRLQRRQVIHVLPDETAFRVVCHASVIGGIIGSNGRVVSNLRRETGAKIHCESPSHGSDHWIVFIVGSTAVDKSFLLTDRVGDYSSGGEREGWVTCEVSAAQAALVRVLERSWVVLAEKDSGGVVAEEEGKEAYCGMLADRSQIGAVLGLGGKNVEWMRRNSAAMIRVLPPPSCGANSDELIQITGDVLAVKKALVMVSTFLQNSPPLNGYPPPLCSKPYDTNGNSEDPHSEFFPNLRSSSSLPNNASAAAAASTSHSPSSRYEEGSSFQGSKEGSGGVVAEEEGKEAYCGMLADRSQIGAVLGLGGKNVEWMRRNSGAMIRVLPPPSCGASSDELIQITGDVLAVKKALVMVSTFLQNSPPLNGYPPPLCSKPYDTNGNSEDPHSEFFPNLRSSSSLPNNASAAAASTSHSPSPRFEEGNSFQGSKDMDKKVVFKMICTSLAAGGIIGKQGTIIRALQNETGASISIGAPLKASGERVVTISARESLESRFSQAQKALVRVFTRSVEIDVGKGLFPGALVKAKLVVPSQFANDLIGNKEANVDVHISVGGQILDCISENEMVIEIMGEYRNVEKALSHVSSKLRENLLPRKDLEVMRARVVNPYENGGANYNLQPPQQVRGDSLSVSDGEQDVKMVRNGTEVMKSIGDLMHTEAVNEEVNGSTPPSLLENDLTQGMKQLQLSGNGDISFLPPRSKGVSLRNVTLELAVEKDALAALYGRDGAGLDNLQQISGARVDVKDAPTEEGETMVLLSGNPEQTRTAMSLIVSILADH